MNYKQAHNKLIHGGHKVRRRCWQPGWLEIGTFQGKPTIFYRNPAPVQIAEYEMPEFYVTYNPNYEDVQAKDWQEVI